MSTVEPSPTEPDKIKSAILSSTAVVINRFSGRAPNTASYPLLPNHLIANAMQGFEQTKQMIGSAQDTQTVK